MPSRFTPLLLLALLPVAAQAQTAASYTFVASGSSAAAYASAQPVATARVRTAGTADEGYYNNLPIGFSFTFAGTAYTTFSASTNGFLVLGQALTGAVPTNNLTSGLPRPLIAPFWDDISFGTPASPADPTKDGDLFVESSGTPGSRVCTIEWRNFRWTPAATGPVASCMVRLYENNTLDFFYLTGSASAAGSSRGASVGLAGPTSGDFYSLKDFSSATTGSNTTETTSISGRPTSGRRFLFTAAGGPLAAATAQAPAHLELAPNPAQAQVRVAHNEAHAPIQLFDGQGRLLRALPGTATVMDLRGLAAGLYLVRAGSAAQRLVVE